MDYRFEKHQNGTVIHFKNGYMAILGFYEEGEYKSEVAELTVMDSNGDWIMLTLDNVWKTITYVEDSEQFFSMDHLDPELLADLLYQVSKFKTK